jgi:uroporphyrinogen-III synthase
MTRQAAKKLNVLITRPEEKGRELALQLKKLGMVPTCQAFFDYQPLASAQQIQNALMLNPDIVIFVSVAAVTYANSCHPIKYWQAKHFIAVGEATQLALQSCVAQSAKIHCPKIHNSEGVLVLPLLQQVKDKNIVIVRGDGGREHLKNTLENKQANVIYIESYQKIWRTLNKNIVKKWQEQQINCIVITSNALLESVVHLLNSASNTDSLNQALHLKNSCLWVVASKRIADNAKQLGLTQVINANGANDQAIITSLRATVSTFQ